MSDVKNQPANNDDNKAQSEPISATPKPVKLSDLQKAADRARLNAVGGLSSSFTGLASKEFLSGISAATRFESQMGAALAAAKANSEMFRKCEELFKPSLQVLSSIEKMNHFANMTKQMWEPITKQMETWQKLQTITFSPSHMSAVERIISANKLWHSDMARLLDTMNGIRLPEYHATLSERLTKPYAAYTRFAESTAKIIAQNNNLKEASRLALSVGAAEIALSKSTASVCKLLDQALIPSKLVGPVPYNLPYQIRDEVIQSTVIGDNCSPEQLFDELPSAVYSNTVHEVVNLYLACNQASIARFGQPMFATTDRVVAVVNSLPHLIATDESTFSRFVLLLWFFVLEAANSKKPRFYTDNNGTLAKQDCEVIHHIRILRHKLVCHDIDQDPESSRIASRQALADTLSWFGIVGLPVSSSHFRQMQSRLIGELRDWLNHLLLSLTSPSN